MSIWHGVKARRSLGGALAAVGISLALTACGGNDGRDDGKANSSAPAAASTAPSQPSDDGANAPSPSASPTLATLHGGVFQFVVNSAKRGEGGFLTVTGTISNTSGKVAIAPVQWSGQEQQVKAQGSSLAAMTLVDAAEKKRYYVLRDTDGNPLTTTDLPNFEPNQTINFYAQFPAPPTSTTEVQMDFPGLDPATIAIS